MPFVSPREERTTRKHTRVRDKNFKSFFLFLFLCVLLLHIVTCEASNLLLVLE